MGIATVVGGALSVGLATAFLRHAQATPHEGPTAATLDEAFSDLLGAGLGLFVGSALSAVLVRRGSRVLAGLLAGLGMYVLAVAPYFFFTDSSDLGLGEEVGIIAAFFPVFLMPFVILGALVGSFVGRAWPRFTGGGSSDGPPFGPAVRSD